MWEEEVIIEGKKRKRFEKIMKNLNITIEAYDSHALKYDQEQWQREIYVNIPELLGRLNSKSPKIVELGCGSGREAKQILDLSPEVRLI